MRALHVYAGPFPSHQGTQVYLKGLLGAQAALGARVALRCWAGGQGEPPPGIELRRLASGHSLASGPSLARVPLAAALAVALAQDLREPWDAVHLHHVEAPLLAALARGPVRVHHLHALMSEELPTYGSRGFGRMRGARRLGAALDRACVRGSDLSVALSPHGAEAARRLGARRVVVVPPGVEPLAPPSAQGVRALGLPRELSVLFTGTCDGYQELDRLFRAMALLDAPLVVVTGSPPGPVRARAGALGLASARLHLIGSPDPAVARAAIAGTTVGVIPRAHCAGFPMKLLNHLALGQPVVALRSAVAPRPGVCLVDDATPQALARSISRLLRDPRAAAAIGQAGQRAVDEDGSWRHSAAALARAVAMSRR